MDIRFDTDEIALLKDLLEMRLSDMRVEVRRAEDPRFHDQLRETEQRVRRILEKIGATNA